MRYLIIFLLSFLCTQSVCGQQPLKRYIDSALAHNIVLRQKNISLKNASYALKIAKGMFYPTVSIQAGYQTANGGRDINIPVGDMLNGVYNTLNQLTQSQTFPQLKNQKINFLPTNFYDAKIHVSVPIINPQLSYNRKIKRQKVKLNAYEVDTYKRELIEKVKSGYYNYLKSLDAISIYQSALKVAQEGKRVNKRLLTNGKGLPAYILRAKSEIEEVKSNLIEAQQKSKTAQRYFNFLLNRNQRATIDTAIVLPNIENKIFGLLNQTVNTSDREELKELKKSVSLRKNLLQMNKSAYYPSLNGFIDVGSQSENWKFNNQSRYYMAGVQLEIPIFKGNRNRYKIKQSVLAIEDTRLNLEYTSQQLKLSGHIAKNKLRSAYQRFLSAQKQLKAAKAYARLIKRGYQEGTNTYIETIDARNQLTKAKQALNINRYQVLKAKAHLERETASYSLK